jgi:methionine sulfoxide reductase heme-binding subunit
VTFLEKLLRSKAFVLILIVLPGLWPAVPVLRQDASVLADLPKYLLHHLGFVACILLVTVLTFSPWRVLFPQSPYARALNRHRRLVGVSAFVYAFLHVTMHFIYEGGFATFGTDLAKVFILSGAIAFTILFLLAVTSVDRAVRILGGKRWRFLHRFVYVAAALVAYHQAAARKIFPLQVVWIFGPLLVLEALRIWKSRAKPQLAAGR